MVYRKLVFTFFLIFLAKGSSFAGLINPALSLIVAHAISNNSMNAQVGVFDIKDRPVNFGFEVSNKFYLFNSYFLKSGIRYNTYRVFVEGLNQSPAAPEDAYLHKWHLGYESLAVPVLLGSDFVTKQGLKGDYYLGASFGVLHWSYLKTESSMKSGSDSNHGTSGTSPELIPAIFFPTLDAGATLYPFKSAPRLSLGIFCSVQLNQTDPVIYHASIQKSGEMYSGSFEHSVRFINCAALLTYTFGNPKPVAKKKRAWDCPR